MLHRRLRPEQLRELSSRPRRGDADFRLVVLQQADVRGKKLHPVRNEQAVQGCQHTAQCRVQQGAEQALNGYSMNPTGAIAAAVSVCLLSAEVRIPRVLFFRTEPIRIRNTSLMTSAAHRIDRGY